MANDRFEALDSWRGICACMVALFHFDVFSHLSLMPLVRNAYLFTDFFFVLSGFVIAANYRTRLTEGYSPYRFMFLRFGRIYPLHFVMLLLFIPIDIAKDGVTTNLFQAIITNIFLLHGLGLNPQNWLDFVSWSISAEFAAYIVFAVVLTTIGKTIWPWWLMAVAAPCILIMFSPNGMDATYDYGLVRCLFGFSLGVICFDLRNRFNWLRQPLASPRETLLEGASILLVIVYITIANRSVLLSVSSPLVFVLIVLVFAREGGAASRALTVPSMLFIGTLTYSIYMLHPLVRAVTRALAMVMDHILKTQTIVLYPLSYNQEATKIIWLNGSLWLGDLLEIAMVIATIGVAALAYRYIESPGREWSRRLSRQDLSKLQPSTIAASEG
jgi:peptidoglycan/LPS O-acetylase OafA/YrhL